MYKIVEIEDTVRVPPSKFSEKREDVVVKILREKYEGLLDRDLGAILVVFEVKEEGEGKVIFGDGAAYYGVKFKALTCKPEVGETIRGEVVDILEYGAFIRMGPFDGLVHVSQITDDFISFDSKNAVLSAKNSKKILKKEDHVRAKVVTVSLKTSLADSKIGLTMRQPGLGKDEWIEKERTEEKKKEEK